MHIEERYRLTRKKHERARVLSSFFGIGGGNVFCMTSISKSVCLVMCQAYEELHTKFENLWAEKNSMAESLAASDVTTS